jgi:hypothetical protein
MLKKVLLAATALSVLPAAFAAEISFNSIFDIITKFLGPQGFDFLTAFGIVFAALWMGLSILPMFREGTARAASVLFAIMGGLGTAFYVYMQKIPFMSIVAPFSLFITFTLFALLIIKVILAAKEGELKGAGLGVMVGIGALIVGIGLLVAGQGAVGGFIVVIGIIILVGSGIFWIAGRGVSGLQFGRVPDRRERARERELDTQSLRESVAALRELGYEAKTLQIDQEEIQEAINHPSSQLILSIIERTERDARNNANLSKAVLKQLNVVKNDLLKERLSLKYVDAAIQDVQQLRILEYRYFDKANKAEALARQYTGIHILDPNAWPKLRAWLEWMLKYIAIEKRLALYINKSVIPQLEQEIYRHR